MRQARAGKPQRIHSALSGRQAVLRGPHGRGLGQPVGLGLGTEC